MVFTKIPLRKRCALGFATVGVVKGILTVLIVFYVLQKLKQIREARRIQKEFKHQRLKEANAASDMIREFEIRSKSVKPYL